MKIAVSILVPGEDSDKYMLSYKQERGWWLPYGIVNKDETIKNAAERIASEVSSGGGPIHARIPIQAHPQFS